jgi:Protein of unknown function (DUF2628)
MAERAARLVFVKQGFCWPALFLGPLWLCFHRLWIALALFLLVLVGMDALLDLSELGQAMQGWCTLALFVYLALEANGLRAWALERRGYLRAGLAAGRSRGEAELDFFRHWLPSQSVSTDRDQARVRDAAARMAASEPSNPPSAEGDDVVGLFP